MIGVERIFSIKYNKVTYKIGARMHEGQTIIFYSGNKKKKSISVDDIGGKENFNKLRAHLNDLGIKSINKTRTY